jgi:predicted PhzF superfamily epimerase YddE/YHI9
VGYTFYIVDVFAEERYAGNQLGIFRDIQALSGAESASLWPKENLFKRGR